MKATYTLIIVPHLKKHILLLCNDILLFLSHNKLWLNDQINGFVINACIFLFSTMIQTACLFHLYIFGLKINLSDLFVIS